MTGNASPLPWALPLGWLRGRPRCRARLLREEAGPERRWGRCELVAGHRLNRQRPDGTWDELYAGTDHALENGMTTVRFRSVPDPDGPAADAYRVETYLEGPR